MGGTFTAHEKCVELVNIMVRKWDDFICDIQSYMAG